MTLPSGRVVRVRRNVAGDAEALDDDEVDGRVLFEGRALRALRGERLAIEGVGEAELMAMPLRDYHALRDLAGRVGAIEEEEETYTCRNCDAPMEIDPREAPVDELLRRYEGDTTAEEVGQDLGRTVRLPHRRRGKMVRMASVTVKDALPLWAVLGRDEPFAVTPEIVRALGVRTIGGEKDPRILARVLDRVDDAIWERVEEGFLRVQYSDRAFVPYTCEKCGALHELERPAVREVLGMGREVPDAAAGKPFPSAEEFESMVERIAPEVYAGRGVQGIAIRVEPGVAAVDDGGEPLLGSYQPSENEFLIEVYYRTFAKMHAEEGAYDLEAEIRETIDHEVEHHLHHLRGYDPLDEQERRELRDDLVKTYGAPTVRRIVAEGMIAELGRFARFAWPFLLVLLLIAGVVAWLESR
jgi:rubrerythrin